MRPNPLTGTQGLSKSFELNKRVCLIGFHGRYLDLNIPEITEFLEDRTHMGLGIVGRLVLEGSIDNRHKVIHVLEADRIGDNIPSFDVICKKYFKIRVMYIMYSHIDCMILSTGVGGILDSMKLDIGKITNYINLLDLSVLLHYLLDELLIHLLQTTDEQLADQYALVDFLRRVRLVLDLLLPAQRHSPQNLQQFGVEVDLIVTDGDTQLMLHLLCLPLRVGFQRIVIISGVPISRITSTISMSAVISLIPII